MSTLASSNSYDNVDDNLALYRHKKRKNWGLAIIAWERGDKRGYQFEDGQVRIFKKGFYKLFEQVEPDEDSAEELVDELQRRLKASQRHAERKARKRNKPAPKPVWSFNDQLRIFTTLYPKHFQDPAWTEGIRGEGAKRRLKRHRDPAREDALELLDDETLRERIERKEFKEVTEDVIELLESTSLVSRSHIGPVRKLEPLQQRNFVLALHDLLYGDDVYARRFDRFLRAVSAGAGTRGPSWQLVTCLPSLIHPNEHVCVHPGTFRKQAAELRPNTVTPRRVGFHAYTGLLELAKMTREQLEDKGLEPRDLLDVKDFIWATLRPSAKKILNAIED